MTRNAGRLLVLSLVLTGPACDARPPATVAEFDIDHDGHRVIRRHPSGQVRWVTPLDGYLGRVRPPHLLLDDARVYVSHRDGVTALDANTGEVRWHSRGPSDRLCLSGDLLLAADCSIAEDSPAWRRWLVAWTVADGREEFKARLPAKDFDPEPIREVAGLFLVQAHEAPGGEGVGLLLDRKGQVRHRLDRQLVDARKQGDDLIMLTSRDVRRVTSDGRVRWAAAFPRDEWLAGGGLLELAEGDLVAYLYGRIADSGVQVARLERDTGEVVWQARCDSLRVTHSEYQHDVAVAIEEGRLKVISEGSSGRFVELLDLKSGRQVQRTQLKQE